MDTPKPKNPLRLILRAAIFIFIILFLAFLGLKTAAVYDPDPGRKNLLLEIVTKVESIGLLSWDFLKPFLQLVGILLIVEWILGKFGISFTNKQSNLEWNVQTVIAIVIIGSFALAALSGIKGVDYLKDLALVVIGFYFGSQKRFNDKDNIKVTEEPLKP